MRLETKHTAIPDEIRKQLIERSDGLCEWCGKPGTDAAHFVPRSLGGRGDTLWNLLWICREHHNAFDQFEDRENMQEFFEAYLREQYGDEWSPEKLIYLVPCETQLRELT